MQFFRFITAFLFFVFFTGCSDPQVTETEKKDSMVPVVTQTDSVPAQTIPQLQVEARTFEVSDAQTKKSGWGYDLYVDGKRKIHQPIIPSRSGNNPFASEADAKKTGDYAARKFMRTGEFPSMTPEELDSLGIK